ncbi:methylated-DNA--[protein]-cysteine S-methyltransferase [Alcanivorax sp. JB21]|uniref:methylated-DNA--[protein]-cysteine S-methyltransferase n=1 Tax=Alcanivorax limicola TaxID=2874102 RepID=UPI001CBDBE8C|nr:methylated-DNA--[protein]-cysteine S-methyltransferase [Alcanivorax limicola]MBZ2188810.1 methylated-DNA--[protein]-cysteine S-methyltransferase [Alcanivorax limicola]
MALSDYERVEKAMAYMVDHASRQPSLDEVAAQVHLSPYHFQRLFSRWAGTTPKRFLQAVTLERSKLLIEDEQALLAVSHSVGLSGGSRLYDHFVQLDAVTPGEYKRKGEGLAIQYGFHPTPFGPMFVAMTQRGICRLAFVGDGGADDPVAALRRDWPLSTVEENMTVTSAVIENLFSASSKGQNGPLSLHVAGTNFQMAVWRALLRIPPGKLASYSQLARVLGRPGAARAVGNAVGANPIALLVPCHRVIQQSGALGGYRWGLMKKQMVQAWELAEKATDPIEGRAN